MRRKQFLTLLLTVLIVTLIVVPALADDRWNESNKAPGPDVDEHGNFPDGVSTEIPGIDLRDSFIEVPTEWELGYNPAEEDGPAPTQGNPKTGTVAVVVNDVAVHFPDQQPYIDQAGRTMIPVRFVSEALGAEVDADSDGVVTIKRGDVVIKHKIGTNTMTANGATKTFDTKSLLTKQYRTMVPLRFVSEALGAKVGWNASTWTATVDL